MSALKVNKTVQQGNNLSLGGFKDYYSNLARNLLKKLPKAPNKFNLNAVFQHFKGIIQIDSFNLVHLNYLKKYSSIQSSYLDNLSSRFLKDGAKVLAKPIIK